MCQTVGKVTLSQASFTMRVAAGRVSDTGQRGSCGNGFRVVVEKGCVMNAWQAVGVLWVCLMFLGGCAQPNAAGKSALCGLWRTAGPSLVFSVSDKGVETCPQRGTIGQAGVMIDADGSFDLTIVLYDEFGDGYERLRAKGDRIYIGLAPGEDESAVYMEVESCTYSPTCSEVIIGVHHEDPSENATVVLSAQLISPNKVLFMLGSFGPGTEGFVNVEVLDRMGAEAARQYDTMTGWTFRRRLR